MSAEPTLTHAIVRRPGANFADGVTTADLGPPDVAAAVAQHEAYCDALTGSGLSVTVLPADPACPDGVFVEDTAVVLDGLAVIGRAGVDARQGEHDPIAERLGEGMALRRIEAPGTLEGGDVLRLGRRLFVGLSARTNDDGAAQLARFASECGIETTAVPVREVLHLKTAVTAVDDQTLLAAGEMTRQDAFAGFRVLAVPATEAGAANCLRVNDRLFIPAGAPRTLDVLVSAGFDPVPVDISEFAKMDGGPTCLSLLW